MLGGQFSLLQTLKDGDSASCLGGTPNVIRLCTVGCQKEYFECQSVIVLILLRKYLTKSEFSDNIRIKKKSPPLLTSLTYEWKGHTIFCNCYRISTGFWFFWLVFLRFVKLEISVLFLSVFRNMFSKCLNS